MLIDIIEKIYNDESKIFKYLEKKYKKDGIKYISNFIQGVNSEDLLRKILKNYGALISDSAQISTKLVIDNAVTNDFSNLVVSDGCYIGKDVFFDLVEKIIIEEDAAISGRVSIITHGDPGTGKFMEKNIYKRKVGGVKIGKKSWIGAGSIILPGVNIGQCCIVGAGAVVNKDIPSFSLAVGVPARVVKQFNKTGGACEKM